MKIAVLSDIHGNLPALEAVLADAAARRADRIVNLGDIVSGPLWPAETAARLMPLDLPTICGNHERQVLTHSPERMGESDRFAAAALGADQRAWLEGLPATMRLSPDISMVHGTPHDDLTYLLETVTADGLRAATTDEIGARVAGADAPVILCGHSHVPRVVRRDDGQLIVNPGSVGLQAYADDHGFPHIVENGTPHARYAMLEGADGQGWTAELVAVDYDWEPVARQAESNGRPDWAIALRTGRMG